MKPEVLISIPPRWHEGTDSIKGFIEHYTEAVGHGVTVRVARDEHKREIAITESGGLAREHYEAADNAIQILNEGLTRTHGELPWEKKPGGLLHRLSELDRISRGAS